MDSGKEVDIWRDTYIRFCGYANEIGESFRLVAPVLYYPSYAVSTLYVLGDVQDKARKTYAKEKKITSTIVSTSVDCLIWQLSASVIVPGLTIKLAVNSSSYLLKKTVKNPFAVRWAPVALGLGLIPFIIHPIDNAVTYAMDSSLRRLYFLNNEDPVNAKVCNKVD